MVLYIYIKRETHDFRSYSIFHENKSHDNYMLNSSIQYVFHLLTLRKYDFTMGVVYKAGQTYSLEIPIV